ELAMVDAKLVGIQRGQDSLFRKRRINESLTSLPLMVSLFTAARAIEYFAVQSRLLGSWRRQLLLTVGRTTVFFLRRLRGKLVRGGFP
ncbi:MAG: hypothetical protein WBF93_03410, partial [Pirellulales bacterium]